jgi:hypothetical protein
MTIILFLYGVFRCISLKPPEDFPTDFFKQAVRLEIEY